MSAGSVAMNGIISIGIGGVRFTYWPLWMKAHMGAAAWDLTIQSHGAMIMTAAVPGIPEAGILALVFQNLHFNNTSLEESNGPPASKKEMPAPLSKQIFNSKY